MTFQVRSIGPEITFQVGEKIAKVLVPGDVIELVGDLGAGKTQLVRGIAAGAGSTDDVQSPSFTVERQYQCSDYLIRHYDFHRLDNAGIMQDELTEAIQDGDVVLIEWADSVREVLPANTKKIEITATSENDRILHFINFDKQP